MKVSGILTFISILLVSILGIVSSLGMEVVLKVGTVYLISFIVLIILATIIFILTLKNKRNLFGIFSTILIIAPVIMLILSRHFSKLDYIAHPNLALNNNTLLVFFIGIALSILFGVINIIVAFTKRSDEIV